MRDDEEPAPAASADDQADSPANSPKVKIVRSRGFDLDKALRVQISADRDLEEILRRIDEDNKQ